MNSSESRENMDLNSEALFVPTRRPFPKAEIPEVIFDEHPEWVELYWEAWRSAWRHVYESAVTPVSYMGEGCATSRVWIWDTSLMSFFCRYAAHTFPGIESLDNLYAIMSGAPAGLKIHHPDNPPLPAWAELEYFRFTGDTARLHRLLEQDRTLERHYEFLENCSGDTPDPAWGAIPLSWRKTPEGYRWNGYSSGMDNTPRGRDDWNGLLWFDAVAQQGLAARSIAGLAAVIGNEPLREKFQREFEQKTELLQRYWDPETGAFQDRRDGAFCRVLTPAIFWPMAANMTTAEQARQIVAHLANPEELGGACPCPTVSRNDPAFTPDGSYWRGAVWVPLAYVASVALRNYDCDDEARRLTEKLLNHMVNTWRGYTPHSIWECYKPDLPEPALNSKGRICRADFCGWSALGPISMLIENLVGIREVSAQENFIRWRSTSPRRHGIRNLRFGGNTVSLLRDAAGIHVTAARPFTLEYNGTRHACPAGETNLVPAEPAAV